MPQPKQHSYLLRLWREHPGAPTRATLIPVGQQPQVPQHFADLESLCVFLRDESGEESILHDWNTPYCTPSEIS
jgi:hypothetical protein